jgi:hypothetical protein
MVWLRYHVAVPPDPSPLAVRLDRDKVAYASEPIASIFIVIELTLGMGIGRSCLVQFPGSPVVRTQRRNAEEGPRHNQWCAAQARMDLRVAVDLGESSGNNASRHPSGSDIFQVPVLLLVSRTQVVFVDCRTDSPAQIRACFLVGPEVNPAVNTSVGDVVANLS